VNVHQQEFIRRVKNAVNPGQTLDLVRWIPENTLIKGQPFSFTDHEYQKYLLQLTESVIYVKKCSQIGVSEIIVRWLLAYLTTRRGVNAIYTLPTARFADRFSATRIEPVIESSPVLKAAVDPTLFSASVRRFVTECMLFMQGASKTSQAISVPAEVIVGDEIDFMEDDSILSSFTSRLSHALDPQERYFSTPTFEGFGVDFGYQKARRHVQLQKCQRCNHQFLPRYYDHVKLPGFTGSLHEFSYLTRDLLDDYDTTKAYLECPKCKRAVDQDIKYREFVVENSESKALAAGLALTPFCAPRHMPPGRIIVTSTKYKKKRDFINFCLGETYTDADSGLLRDELAPLFTSDVRFPEHPPYQVLGADLGGTCAMIRAYPAPNGHLRVTKVDWVPLHKMREEFPKALATGRVISAVIDALPYSDLVKALQDACPSLFAALKSNAKGMELYNVREVEDDEEKATYGIRQLNYKRNALLDFVMLMLRGGQISFAPSCFDDQEKIIDQLTDMRRVEEINKKGEKEFVWRKSPKGYDHTHHALMFMVLANFIKGIQGGSAPLPSLIAKFKPKKEI
jgi:hypothetical protein